MKRQSIRAAFLLLCLLPAMVSGQDAADPAPTSDDATHEAIRALRDALIQAVNSKDVAALTNLVHENVILTAQDGDQLATIRGRDGVRDYVNRLLTGPEAGVQQMTVNPVVDELTILHGDDAGIASGSSTDDYTLRDGDRFTLKTRWSATVVRDDAGNWLLAGLHVSTNLFDNPVLDALKQYALYVGVAAGLAGLLVGYVAARLLGRRSHESSASQALP